MVSNPLSLVEFGLDSMDPENVLSGLADLLSTRAGASAAWAHFVAGDIVVSGSGRGAWIWMPVVPHASHRYSSVSC